MRETCACEDWPGCDEEDNYGDDEMTEVKHTPAPWTIERYSISGMTEGIRVKMPTGFCAMTSALDPDKEGNARLIAAAPELLTTLKLILELNFIDNIREKASKAISKAEGGQ